MLKEDPELSALTAEQQLRIAARRVNRQIDFDEAQREPYRSSACKRSAAERESEEDEASRTRASAGALRAGRLDGRDGMEAPREFSDERGAVGPEFAESPKNSLRPVAAEGGIRGMREIWLL
jgi:hypothetical protein